MATNQYNATSTLTGNKSPSQRKCTGLLNNRFGVNGKRKNVQNAVKPQAAQDAWHRAMNAQKTATAATYPLKEYILTALMPLIQ